MSVLFICQEAVPTGGLQTSRSIGFATELTRLGFNVELLTSKNRLLENSSLIQNTHRIQEISLLPNKTIIAGSALIDKKGEWLQDPQLTTIGLIDDGEKVIIEKATQEAISTFNKLLKIDRMDDDIVREALRISIRRTFKRILDKKPQTTVHLVRF